MDEAIIEYRQALRCEPYSTLTRTSLGTALMTVGQRDEGMACLREAVAQDPDDVYSLVNLGSFLVYVGSPQNAVSPLRKAISLNFTNADAHAFLGNALFATSQNQAASNEFRIALTLNASNETSLLGLANCLTASGQNDDAAKFYEQVLASDPQHAESHFQLAVIRASQNQKQIALAHFREAARLMPNWMPALNNLARLLATDPNSTPTDRIQAVSLAQHAVELSAGQDAVAFDTLGVALARNELFSEASNAAHTALQLAMQAGQTNFAADIQKRLELYNKGVVPSQ
jgi:tetratricopeptide (TPR) repeat protein